MHGTTLPLPPPASRTARTADPQPLRSFAPLTAPTPVGARDLVLALLGLLALGSAAALGGAGPGPGLRLIPSVLLVELAALTLTAPALIAIHQFLRLAAAPETLAAALGRALIHGGRVAAGLAIVILFFAATTKLAAPMLLLALAGVGVFTSATACVELRAAEQRARATPAMVPPAFTLLLVGWVGLSWLVALRVGVDVAAWVLGFHGLGGLEA